MTVIRPADPGQAEELTELMYACSAYRGEYASILHDFRLTAADLTAVRIVSHPRAAEFYRRQGAEQVRILPPSPPRVTWSRPEFTLPVPAPAG
ncbi:hypothetical protein [Crossiella sp. CA198]|uniref:hypothetical protein n=1 Tax=Crossiella sp. CA198 TaxID=3455607 RepID=UPI003F8CFE74